VKHFCLKWNNISFFGDIVQPSLFQGVSISGIDTKGRNGEDFLLPASPRSEKVFPASPRPEKSFPRLAPPRF
jgi:hypothetical protein